MNARNAVADADDRADFVDRNGLLVVLNLLAQNLADFVCLNIRHACSVVSVPVVPPPCLSPASNESVSTQPPDARASHSTGCATSHRKWCPRSAQPRHPIRRDQACTSFQSSCRSAAPALPPSLSFAPHSIRRRKKPPPPQFPAAAG